MKKNIQRANTLIEAIPYIKKFNSKTIVFKYGGSIGSEDFSNFARDLVLMKLVGIKPKTKKVIKRISNAGFVSFHFSQCS